MSDALHVAIVSFLQAALAVGAALVAWVLVASIVAPVIGCVVRRMGGEQ